MPKNSLEAIFSKIDLCNEIFELYEKGLIPPNNYGEEYFFISYSHSDFRFVYKDLFALQKEKLEIWFDRGMTPGRDWDETAEHFIANFACKGIILYLGEHSFSSKAVLKEIALAKKYDKPIIPFVIDPNVLIDNDIALTYKSKMKLDEAETRLIEGAFNQKTLWIDASFPIKQKLNYVKNLRDNRPVVEVVEFNKQKNMDMVPNIGLEEGKIAINLNNRQLHEVSLKEDIGFIYKVAFANSDNIETLDLSHVVSIDDYAFANCDKLTNLTLGQLEYLGVSCFEGCKGLKEVTFNHNPHKKRDDFLALLKEFDDIKIDGEITQEELAQAINEISIEQGAEDYELYDQEHFPEREFKIGGKDTRVNLLDNCKRLFANCSSLSYVEIPLNLFEDVPEECFLNCSSLTTVKMANVMTIKKGAFRGCSSLSFIDFPDPNISYEEVSKYLSSPPDVYSETRYLTKIEEEAFYGCSSLTNFLLPFTICVIEDYAFAKSGITQVYLYNVKTLGEGAFEGCKNLYDVELDSYYLTSVPDRAFMGCKALAGVILGERVDSIGINAFFACEALEGIEGDLYVLNIIGENAFRRSGLRHFSFQSSSVSIHVGAFASCHELSEISFANGARVYIDHDAFFDTPNLKKILLPRSLYAKIDFAAFSKSLECLFYPGSEQEYQEKVRIEFSIVDKGCVGHYYGESYDDIPEDRDDFLMQNQARLDLELEKRLRFYSETPIYDGRHWRYNEAN
nr:leucine-rich repeat protein [Bacilli bacterium]